MRRVAYLDNIQDQSSPRFGKITRGQSIGCHAFVKQAFVKVARLNPLQQLDGTISSCPVDSPRRKAPLHKEPSEDVIREILKRQIFNLKRLEHVEIHVLDGTHHTMLVHETVQLVSHGEELVDGVLQLGGICNASVDNARVFEKALNVKCDANARVQGVASKVVEFVDIDAVGIVGDDLVLVLWQVVAHRVYELASQIHNRVVEWNRVSPHDVSQDCHRPSLVVRLRIATVPQIPVKSVTQRSVSQIVAQTGEFERQWFQIELRLTGQKGKHKLFGKMSDANAVLKSGVRCARKHVMHRGKLLDAFETLKLGRIDQDYQRRFPTRVPVHAAANGFFHFFFLHFTSRSRCKKKLSTFKVDSWHLRFWRLTSTGRLILQIRRSLNVCVLLQKNTARTCRSTPRVPQPTAILRTPFRREWSALSRSIIAWFILIPPHPKFKT